MKLVLFDIDGTILNSVSTDDACFVETFIELHGIDISEYTWEDFIHITDSGLTREIFQRYYGRLPIDNEVDIIKAHYFKLLSNRIMAINEIHGASAFINSLLEDNRYHIGFATGGWRETALLKTENIEVNIDQHTFKTASDHYDRGEIIKLAIRETKEVTQVEKFDSITYFGDGMWDFLTTQKLSINFIGVDYQRNNILSTAGAETIINDFQNIEKVHSLLNRRN